MCLGLFHQQMGGDLGTWDIEAPQPAPGEHVNIAEQTMHHAALPQAHHSYSHRKRR